MGKPKTTGHQFKTWDAYADEAAHEPFVLKRTAEDEDPIIIETLSGNQAMLFARAYRSGDVEQMLTTVCGTAWKEVSKLIGPAPLDAMNNLLTDIMLHFDIVDPHTLVGPAGDTVTEKDPRIIRRLVAEGYQLKGEAGGPVSSS